MEGVLSQGSVAIDRHTRLFQFLARSRPDPLIELGRGNALCLMKGVPVLVTADLRTTIPL